MMNVYKEYVTIIEALPPFKDDDTAYDEGNANWGKRHKMHEAFSNALNLLEERRDDALEHVKHGDHSMRHEITKELVSIVLNEHYRIRMLVQNVQWKCETVV